MEPNSNQLTNRKRRTQTVAISLLTIVAILLTVEWVTLAQEIPNQEEAARINAEIVQLKISRDSLIEEIGALRVDRDKLEADEKEINQLIATKESLNRDIDNLMEEKASILEERNRRDQDLRETEEEIKNKESIIQSLLNREMTLKNSIDKLSKQHEGTEPLRHEIENLTNVRSGLETEITTLTKLRNELTGSVNFLNDKESDLEARIAERENHANNLENDSKSVEIELKTKQELLNTANNELVQVQANLNQGKIDIVTVSIRLEKLNSLESSVRQQLNDMLSQLREVEQIGNQNESSN